MSGATSSGSCLWMVCSSSLLRSVVSPLQFSCQCESGPISNHQWFFPPHAYPCVFSCSCVLV